VPAATAAVVMARSRRRDGGKGGREKRRVDGWRME
jgi:hypothetical protein